MNDEYYGIWVTSADGDTGWLIIQHLIFWAPSIEIAKAQLKFLEINGEPTAMYTIRPFSPFQDLY